MNTDQRSAGRLDASSDLANLRPLHDQVLVKLEEEPEQVGAIYVPKTAQNRGPRTAIVVAVGPGRVIGEEQSLKYPPPHAVVRREPMGVEVGDRVLLGPDPGWELPDGHRMLRIGAVLAVLS